MTQQITAIYNIADLKYDVISVVHYIHDNIIGKKFLL